jgi:transcriptional regulator with XRE-family HTH domain
MNKFATAFRKARLNSDKTFRQISEKIGLSIGYLSDIENSKRNPPELSIVEKIEEFFDVTDNHLTNLARKERVANPISIGNLMKSQPKLQEVMYRIDALPDDEQNEKLDEILEELRKKFVGENDPWFYRNLQSIKFMNEEEYFPR